MWRFHKNYYLTGKVEKSPKRDKWQRSYVHWFLLKLQA